MPSATVSDVLLWFLVFWTIVDVNSIMLTLWSVMLISQSLQLFVVFRLFVWISVPQNTSVLYTQEVSLGYVAPLSRMIFECICVDLYCVVACSWTRRASQVLWDGSQRERASHAITSGLERQRQLRHAYQEEEEDETWRDNSAAAAGDASRCYQLAAPTRR